MEHHHAGTGEVHRSRLAIVFGLTFLYFLAEVVGALWTNSLALLADAAHMLTDVAGLGLALFAIWFAARPADPRKSYGYYRIEILVALLNGAILLAVGGYVLFEAWGRLREPPEVSAGGVILIAGIGLIINLIGVVLLRDGAAESLNVQGAFLEVVADFLGSLGVLISGFIIWTTGWEYADPLFSIAIGLFVIPRTLRLMSKAVNILMEGVPEGIDVGAIEAALNAVPGVRSIHDLHVWGITSGVVALSAHVHIAPTADSDAVLDQISRLLDERFDLHHSTIQIERSSREEEIYHLPKEDNEQS